MQDLKEAYKEVMSHWPSGVAILTSEHKEQCYGMTVSSFTSVSLTPAMISVCVDKRAQMSELLQKSQRMAVNILDSRQEALALIFADHDLNMSARFAKTQFKMSALNNPILEHCLGWLDCQIRSFHDTGDHLIYVGEVLEAHATESLSPLIFHRRGFKSF